MKNVLVTGGAGFIGANFVHYLLSKHPEIFIYNLDLLTYAGHLENLVNIPDKERHSFINGDICDANLISEIFEFYQIDTVVHFAAETHVDRSIVSPGAFARTNVEGTLTLLNQVIHSWKKGEDWLDNVRFHHISTDEVYGELSASDSAFTESTPYHPNSPYSASKASSDHFVRAFGHTYGLPYTLSNCSNNYGPYQYPEKLIPLVILNALNELPIPVYGKGEQIRDWLYVRDHCEAIDIILERGLIGETYNIGGQTQIKNLALVEMICDLLADAVPRSPGKNYNDLITFVEDRPGHDFRYSVSIEKMQQEFNWRPSHTIESGIQKTIRWYLDNQDWLQKVTQ